MATDPTTPRTINIVLAELDAARRNLDRARATVARHSLEARNLHSRALNLATGHLREEHWEAHDLSRSALFAERAARDAELEVRVAEARVQVLAAELQALGHKTWGGR